MKTNVVMESVKDRELFGVIIRQETKTGMLSLTDLQEAYTHARVLNGWSDKQITDILNQKENSERIYYLLKEQGLIKTDFPVFIENLKNTSIIKFLKEVGAYKTSGRGDNKRTSCNPYIWVLVAMELSPMLYAKVVTWLTDSLILNRIEAGNFYKELSAALYKLPERIDYPKLAEALNIKIFGKHEVGIRNKGSKEELEKLYILEANMAFGINKGFYKTQDEVLKAINEY